MFNTAYQHSLSTAQGSDISFIEGACRSCQCRGILQHDLCSSSKLRIRNEDHRGCATEYHEQVFDLKGDDGEISKANCTPTLTNHQRRCRRSPSQPRHLRLFPACRKAADEDVRLLTGDNATMTTEPSTHQTSQAPLFLHEAKAPGKTKYRNSCNEALGLHPLQPWHGGFSPSGFSFSFCFHFRCLSWCRGSAPWHLAAGEALRRTS